jgi:hypothetical protein
MSSLKETIQVNMICPYCKFSFRKKVEYQKKSGLFSVLIKNHQKSDNCPPFIAFLDSQGKHRGSQKIDKVESGPSISDKMLENARKNINELENTLRFYHLKVPRKAGIGFDHKVANVKDREFMSSNSYMDLMSFLTIYEGSNTFGIMAYDDDINIEGRIVIYGKYLGMIYIFLWKDQKTIQNKSFDELKGLANLTVEKLIGIYDLADLFY